MAEYSFGGGWFYGYVNITTPTTVNATGSTTSVALPFMQIKGYSTNPYEDTTKTWLWALGRYWSNGVWANYTDRCPLLYNGSTLIARCYANTTTRATNNWYANATWTTPTVSVNTSTLFNSSNSTTKTVPLTLRLPYRGTLVGQWVNSYGETGSTGAENATAFDMAIINVVLDAPPTYTLSTLSFDTTDIYANLTTASITVSNLSAKYGGTITDVTLTIGNQTASRTDNGTLSILLNQGGTFTPTVTVTDSRGQTTTKTLDTITVNVYTAPSVSFDAERTTSTGTPDDEGTYATITPTFTFTDVIATLSAPTIAVTDDDGNAQTVSTTWYSSRANDGTLSGSVNWSSLSSGDTVYGLVSITGGFNTQKSYQITLTPEDSESTGTPITQTLATAFYTLDFLAGGHGIAFGKPAINTGFECAMDATFVDANGVMRALFDFIYPVGSYYETSDIAFDPNVTWGGTWSLEAEGLVHIGAGSNYTVGDTGGEATHTLTVNEMPKHSHTMNVWPNGAHYYTPSGSTLLYWWSSGYGSAIDQATSSVGGDQAHNNMQPYVVVNRWHRTA